MTRRIVLSALALLLVVCCCTFGRGGGHDTTAGDYRLTGPITHGNLSIYLIHGRDQLGGKKYLTLAEAMEQKTAVVHETGNVNELAIEDVSKSDDADIYVQSGDIVKGGQQDRTLGTDYILTRAMGKQPIASFCVEHGRWTQRGGE